MTFLPQSLIDGPVGPNKDLVINGFMDVNQRGLGSRTTTGLVHDRMSVFASELPGLFSADDMAFPPAHGQVPQNPDNYLRVSFNGTLGGAGTEHYAGFRYKFPYPQRMTNQEYTVEFYGRVNNPLTVGIEGRLAANSGNPADDVNGIDYKTHAMTTTGIWKRNRFLINVPTWTPSALGSFARYELLFWLSMGAARTEPLNVGPQAADFDIVNFGVFPGNLLHVPGDLKGLRDAGMELLRSQRFFYHIPGITLRGQTAGFYYQTPIGLPFTMIRDPDVTYSFASNVGSWSGHAVTSEPGYIELAARLDTVAGSTTRCGFSAINVDAEI
ncbi:MULTISPECIES: hypothetical protein [Stappiaceae]|uniref:hypothetical protein n=1 Tax=Stappiaceae TaxID=2821832 RepID=UPI001267ABF4|nr:MULTISPECIES: hypothetical protein [Stappiaceae]MBN8181027.1 hypothetical protein [Roseibium aggregatum]QFT70685.1 hypothetical protein FIU93_28130 [Labrenzia sp. THAF35]